MTLNQQNSMYEAKDDDRTHAAFDRYLHPHRPSAMPSSTKRRLIFSYRTVYTTAICIVIGYRYSWAGSIQYLSPMLSALGATLYLGDFQKNFVSVFYGTIVGAGIGTVIGYTYTLPALQLTLLFIALVCVNRVSTWDRVIKVFSGLNITLATFLPTLTSGSSIGINNFNSILSVVFIPYIITFLTLLLPIPALAIEAARLKSATICREMSAMIIVLVRGFIAQDFHDLYNADFDHLYRDCEQGKAIMMFGCNI